MKHQLVIVLYLSGMGIAMHIPEDTEVLEGYHMEALPEIYPEDEYFEIRSLTGQQLLNPIRDKRDSNYIVLESPGLRSHFKLSQEFSENPQEPIEYKDYEKNNDFMQNIAYNKLHPPAVDAESGGFLRKERSVDTTENNDTTVQTPSTDTENLPKAEKQIMDNYMQSDQQGRWTKAPYEYARLHEEDDSLAEASINEGIKARTPRVNFVTQQKKTNSELNESSDQKSSATKSEVYLNSPEKPPQIDRYLYHRAQAPDISSRYQYQEPDYSRRYDRYVDKYFMNYFC